MKSCFKTILFSLSNRFLLLLSLMLFVMVFSVQPVQGASLITDPSGPNCHFSAPVLTKIPSSEDKPIKVSIGIYLLDLIQLNEIRQSFEAKFFMKIQWQDRRLARELRKKSITYCNLELDDVWYPQTYLYNQRQSIGKLDKVASVNSEGIVTYRQIFNAELKSPLDFQKFPFDSQQLLVKIVSLDNTPEEIEFVKNEELIGVSEKLSFVGWTVGVPITRAGVEKIKFLPRAIPFFEFEIEVKRQFAFLVWHSIFPLLMIILAVYLVFWLEPTQIVPQVALTSVTFLAVIAYQLELASRRPQASYLTRDDIFLIGCIFLIGLALIETIITYKFAQGEQQSLASNIDIWMRYLFPILLLGLILFTCVWG